jgi:hypothetical protein
VTNWFGSGLQGSNVSSRTTAVADDLPSDVKAVLGQLLASGQDALATGDIATARDILGTTRTVARTKLPAGPRRNRLLHGCDRVEALLGGDDHDTAAATAYFAAMRRRLDDPDG